MDSLERGAALDDPIWPYILAARLTPYLESVRKFWNNIVDIEIKGTGVFDIDDKDAPAGLFYRVTNTPVRSPIKGIQVFPFVPTTYLQISNVTGGAVKMINRVCSGNKFILEEFTIIEKSNLPSTYHQGQFVAFVPTKLLEETSLAGKWVYLKADEMISMIQDYVPDSVKGKLIRYV